MQRAKAKLGESGYNLFGNNCEHFATWCKSGDWESQQVGRTVGGTASGLGLVALGAMESTVAAPGILGLLGATTTVPLLGAAALPVAIFGGAFLAYKLFTHDD